MQIKDLTKRQVKTLKSIARYSGGFSSSSKAFATHRQLQKHGLLDIEPLGVQLTAKGLQLAKTLLEQA